MRNRSTVTQNFHSFSGCRTVKLIATKKKPIGEKRKMQNEKINTENHCFTSDCEYDFCSSFLSSRFFFVWRFRFYFSLFLFYSCFNRSRRRRCDPNVCVGFFLGCYSLYFSQIYIKFFVFFTWSDYRVFAFSLEIMVCSLLFCYLALYSSFCFVSLFFFPSLLCLNNIRCVCSASNIVVKNNKINNYNIFFFYAARSLFDGIHEISTTYERAHTKSKCPRLYVCVCVNSVRVCASYAAA